MKKLFKIIKVIPLLLVLVVSSVALDGLLPQQASAVTAEHCSDEKKKEAMEKNYLLQGIDYYDPCSTACNSASGGALSVLTGDTNAEKIFSWLVGKGLNAAAAAGVLGNMSAESELNPFRFQGGVDSRQELLSAGNTYGKAWGLVQWDGSRRVAVLDRLKSVNATWFDTYIDTKYGGSAEAYTNAPEEIVDNFIIFELEYIHQEASPGGNRSGTWPGLMKISNTEEGALEAAVFFHDDFEGSADSPDKVRNGARGTRAVEYYNALKDGATNSKARCSSVPSGSVTYYSQYDPRWANIAYAGHTIGPVGCGPTSMAIILATLVDKNITPQKVAAVAGEQSGGTSSHANLIDGVNSEWNLSISKKSLTMDEAIEFVKSGKGFVWMGGSGPVPFTTGGHLIAMVGVKENGDITIADPANPPHEKIKDYPRSLIESNSRARYGVEKP